MLEFTHFLKVTRREARGGDKKSGNRLNEVPEFAAYAIANGIRRAFTRFGRWIRVAAQAPAAGIILGKRFLRVPP